MGKNGVHEIVRHSFFKKYNIDWMHLRTAEQPFVPQLEKDDDISYFDDAIIVSASDKQMAEAVKRIESNDRIRALNEKLDRISQQQKLEEETSNSDKLNTTSETDNNKTVIVKHSPTEEELVNFFASSRVALHNQSSMRHSSDSSSLLYIEDKVIRTSEETSDSLDKSSNKPEKQLSQCPSAERFALYSTLNLTTSKVDPSSPSKQKSLVEQKDNQLSVSSNQTHPTQSLFASPFAQQNSNQSTNDNETISLTQYKRDPFISPFITASVLPVS